VPFDSASSILKRLIAGSLYNRYTYVRACLLGGAIFIWIHRHWKARVMHATVQNLAYIHTTVLYYELGVVIALRLLRSCFGSSLEYICSSLATHTTIHCLVIPFRHTISCSSSLACIRSRISLILPYCKHMCIHWPHLPRASSVLLPPQPTQPSISTRIASTHSYVRLVVSVCSLLSYPHGRLAGKREGRTCSGSGRIFLRRLCRSRAQFLPLLPLTTDITASSAIYLLYCIPVVLALKSNLCPTNQV
jgi:hypothetical protein